MVAKKQAPAGMRDLGAFFAAAVVPVSFSALYLAISLGLLSHSPVRRRNFVDMFLVPQQ